MPTFDEVAVAVKSERKYSLAKWGEELANHEIAAWITYMQHCLDDARKIASTNSPETPALDCIRKVANLAIACMMEHGAPHREDQ
jgi:hypothetical protein